MRCHQCGHHVVQQSGSQIRLRTQGPLVFDAERGKCQAKCFWCKADVDLPIKLILGEKMPNKPLIVNKRRRLPPNRG